MKPYVVPAALRKGARIRVIAPSSPFDRALFFRGVAWLSERYKVVIGRHVFERDGFLAGTDESRLTDLEEALADDAAGAIVAARGGYGAGRIVHRADWMRLKAAPKWIVGFSDVTLLHVEALRVGVCAMHAENAAGLGRADASAREHWRRALEEPHEPRVIAGAAALGSGQAHGPLVGGNLTMLFTAHAAGRLSIPKGAILALEDVTEASYRVDRMLSALEVSGALAGVAGVLAGDFTDCPEGPHRVPTSTVLAERLGALNVPVVLGARFGHGRHNAPLPLGLNACVDADNRTVTVGLP